MKRLFLLGWICAVLPVAAMAATPAPTSKPAAKPVAATTPEIEAVSIFGRACVETRGAPDKMKDVFAKLEKEGAADALSEDEAKDATGHDAKHAWAMQSPLSKQELLVSQDEDGSCNLFVHRGNVTPMRDEFKRLAVWDAVQQKSKLGAKTKTKDADGVPLTLDYYEVLTADKSKRPMYILSSAAKPKGDTQFLLTYKTIESKIAAPK